MLPIYKFNLIYHVGIIYLTFESTKMCNNCLWLDCVCILILNNVTIETKYELNNFEKLGLLSMGMRSKLYGSQTENVYRNSITAVVIVL